VKTLFGSARLALIAASLGLFVCALPARAQSVNRATAGAPGASAAVSYTDRTSSSTLPAADSQGSAGDELALPEAPDPPAEGGGRERAHMAEAGNYRQAPFSRVGIGADVNPLGIGIKGAIVLNHYYDARMNVNFFNYNSGRFEVEGFNVNADLHMASAGASFDWYPMGSIWRVSPGLMLFNGNQFSGSTDIVAGTSFTIDNQTYYSAKPNAVTGATPLVGTGVVSLHKNEPAFTVAGGFGKFIPRSDRHWSFPTEFGVIFNGAPSIKINASGWACTDFKQTRCSDIGDPTNPIAIQFNNSLQSQLSKWNRELGKVTIYPLFSYSVVYSFDIRK
jgi:hypothetical protein